MGALSIAKYVGIGLAVLLVLGGAWMLRNELIEKGKNIVYAQDNAARVKAQDDQAARDKILIEHQNAYIVDLQNAGTQVKEKIRVVQGPCINDGRGDPRLGSFDEWLRSRQPGNSGPPDSGPTPKGALR